jgi:type IX secretion system PorP/SprF family membrane protein
MHLNKKQLIALKVVNLILFLIICKNAVIFAQDIHFSQFQSTPLFINAANTGTSSADFRFTNDYRSQWRQIDVPYRTLMLAGDGRFSFFNRLSGIGALIMHDESLSNYFTTDKIFLSFSHSVFYKNNRFVVGIQPGIVLKNLSNEGVTFGNQFDSDNEVFNPFLPSSENSLYNDLRYFDLNVGFLWQSRIKTIVPSLGLGINHINRPVESFFANEEEDPLPLKYTFHGNIFIPLSNKYAIVPQVLYSFTSGGREFIGGTIINYYPYMKGLGLNKIYALSTFRINPVRNFDAIIMGVGAEVAAFDVCFSYDVNVSTLRKVSRFQGAYEISLIFSMKRKPKINPEPCFML